MKIAIDNSLLVNDLAELRAIDYQTINNRDKRVIGYDVYVYYLNATFGIKPNNNVTEYGRWVKSIIIYDVFEPVEDDYDFVANEKTEVINNDVVTWSQSVIDSKNLDSEKLAIKGLITDPVVLSKKASSINYKTELESNLYAVRTFTNGFLTHVDYYADELKNNLCLTVNVAYQTEDDALYEAGKTVNTRTTTRQWYKNNGKVDPNSIKITSKEYTHPVEKNAEGKRRRSNIFNIAAQDLVICLMATDTGGNQEDAEQLALAFASQYEDELTNYVNVVAVSKMVDAFTNDLLFVWLNNVLPDIALITGGVPNAIVGETIRAYLIRSFKGEL